MNENTTVVDCCITFAFAGKEFDDQYSMDNRILENVDCIGSAGLFSRSINEIKPIQ